MFVGLLGGRSVRGLWAASAEERLGVRIRGLGAVCWARCACSVVVGLVLVAALVWRGCGLRRRRRVGLRGWHAELRRGVRLRCARGRWR